MEGAPNCRLLPLQGYHKAPSPRFWNGQGRLEPSQTSPKNAREALVLLWMMCYNRFYSSLLLSVEFHRRIGRRISVRAINRRLLADGYPSPRPTRYPRLTRKHRRRRRQWARWYHDWDLRHWVHCVFSDESKYIAVMFGFEFADVKGRDILMLVCNKQMAMWCHPLWYGAPFTSEARGSKSLLRAHEPASLLTAGPKKKFLPWARGTFRNTFVLVQNKAPPHEARATKTFL